MLEKDSKEISVKRQCALLGLCRSSLYYKPRAIRAEDVSAQLSRDDAGQFSKSIYLWGFG